MYSCRWLRIAEWLTGGYLKRHEPRRVLDNIELEIERGEAFGLIGMNGAERAHFSSLITGTAHPSAGEIKVNGRVAALLELGMGFHVDLTGRENVRTNGRLAGLTDKAIEPI